jgi:dienelactone hydrolase
MRTISVTVSLVKRAGRTEDPRGQVRRDGRAACRLDVFMHASVEWHGRRVVGAVIERSFRIIRDVGTVPGALWLPASWSASCPLVLLGHGGSGHKRSKRVVESARWFATHAGLAAMAIDGPYHGDRVSAQLSVMEYQTRIADVGIEAVLDRMTDDWRTAVDSIGEAGLVDADRLAYLGMSMGARFGLPVAAALGDRFRCVVIGKFGLQQASSMHQGMAAPRRVVQDARQIKVPVLFHIQWQDEIFPRDGQSALFDVLGSKDKHLIGYDGSHAEARPDAVAHWRHFIANHVTTAN